ncbi:hypothetical protein CU102_17830, partial [Phyllobacterium brassicacearum]
IIWKFLSPDIAADIEIHTEAYCSSINTGPSKRPPDGATLALTHQTEVERIFRRASAIKDRDA